MRKAFLSQDLKFKNPRTLIILFALFLVAGLLLFKSFPVKTEDSSGDEWAEESIKLCKDDPRKVNCFSRFFTEKAEPDNLRQVFLGLKKLYDSNPEIRPSCHQIALRMGEYIYEKLSDPSQLALSPETAFCNYGFYQQYPASMLRATKSIDSVKSFCFRVGEEIGKDVPDAQSECFRGIGHALPFVSGNPNPDPLQMSRFAVDNCKKIASIQKDYQFCLSGSFNRLGKAEIEGLDGLEVNKIDPLSICKEFEEEVSIHCYRNFEYTGLSLINKDDIERSFAQLAELYKDKQGRGISSSVFNLGYDLARRAQASNSDFLKEAEACSKIPQPYDLDCVNGVSVGIAKNGEPGKQYVDLINFCKKARSVIKDLKPEDCPSGYSLQYITGIYSEENAAIACKEIKTALGRDCDPATIRGISWSLL
jgi:hypothetical protein